MAARKFSEIIVRYDLFGARQCLLPGVSKICVTFYGLTQLIETHSICPMRFTLHYTQMQLKASDSKIKYEYVSRIYRTALVCII